jgi:pimeloyl-ACP methyl ester carboxylesterase
MADAFEGYDEVVEARHANSALKGHAQCLLAGTVKAPGERTPPPVDPWPEQLSRISVPVTVVAGERDPLLEPGWEQHLEGASDAVRAVRIDAKHAPSLDHPETVADIVRDTVRRAGELVGAGTEEQ